MVIVDAPAPTAETSPDVSTFATDVSEDLYDTVMPVTAPPEEFVAENTICALSPTRSVSNAGDSVKLASCALPEHADPSPQGAVGPVPFSLHPTTSVRKPARHRLARRNATHPPLSVAAMAGPSLGHHHPVCHQQSARNARGTGARNASGGSPVYRQTHDDSMNSTLQPRHVGAPLRGRLGRLS